MAAATHWAPPTGEGAREAPARRWDCRPQQRARGPRSPRGGRGARTRPRAPQIRTALGEAGRTRDAPAAIAPRAPTTTRARRAPHPRWSRSAGSAAALPAGGCEPVRRWRAACGRMRKGQGRGSRRASGVPCEQGFRAEFLKHAIRAEECNVYNCITPGFCKPLAEALARGRSQKNT